MECFSEGSQFRIPLFVLHILTYHSDPPFIPEVPDHSRTVNKVIPISLDPAGRPALPSITACDNYKTKKVQSMLRDYCAAHIRVLIFNHDVTLAEWHYSGFLTAKPQAIPWASLAKDPTCWIAEECTPDGFEWKDPSKIRIKEIFRLLTHWNVRQSEGLEPLIWVATCPLLEDAQGTAKCVLAGHRARALEPQDSDEERFILPATDEIDPESDASDDDQRSERSTHSHVSSDSVNTESGPSDPHRGNVSNMLRSGVFFLQIVRFLPSFNDIFQALLDHRDSH
jgi:hypothetical protein